MAQDLRENGNPGGRTGWRDRVAFSLSWNERFAYVPDQVLVLGDLTPEQAAGVRELGLVPAGEESRVGVLLVRTFTRSGSDVALDVPLVVRQLRVMGVTAQPNHVFFADANPLGANPFLANPFLANPFLANPFLANPFLANPFLANPFLANPFLANPFLANPFLANPFLANPFLANRVWGNPLWGNLWGNPIWTSRVPFDTFLATGVRRSTAVPVGAPPGWPAPSQGQPGGPKVVVLDTGYSGKDTKPPFVPASIDPAVLPTTDVDIPDKTGQDVNAQDGYLDPVAGHGTFIAGLIARLEPTVDVKVRHVVEPEGDVSETALIQALRDIAKDPPKLLNLSLSGYALDDMMALRLAVADLQAKGTVVVASAGNDGLYIPTYPASLPGVVSVGAIGPSGPAPFTNWGPWVRACAPGVGVVSSFFNWDGTIFAPPGVTDAEKFSGWAQWDGTSFSAPVVVGALAHEMVARGVTAAQAVERLIDAPGLTRIPYLGTVVNVL